MPDRTMLAPETNPLFTLFARDYTFNVLDLLLVLAASFALGMVIAVVYKLTHREPSYSASFTVNIPVIGMVVACVMLIVGTNIAGAVTLLGALSVVRFRNAVKETRDVAFLFFTMAVGIACGTRFYLMATVMTAAICAVLYVLTVTRFGVRRRETDLLKIVVPEELDYEGLVRDVFQKYVRRHSLVSIHMLGQGRKSVSYTVSLRSPADRDALVRDLLPVAVDQQVVLLRGEHLIEI